MPVRLYSPMRVLLLSLAVALFLGAAAGLELPLGLHPRDLGWACFAAAFIVPWLTVA